MHSSLKLLLSLSAAFLAACASMAPQSSRVDFDSHLLLAEISRERQEFAAAAEHYLAAAMIAEDPGLAELTAELAQQLGLVEIGIQAAERWQALRPADTRVHQYLGLFKLRSGDGEGAKEEFAAFIAGASEPSAAACKNSPTSCRGHYRVRK